MDDEQRERIKAAMEQLRPRQRQLLELYHFEQRSYAEIGQLLQWEEAAVKRRLNRARLVLRAKMRRDGGD